VMKIRGEFVVESLVKSGCNNPTEDVHYLGLELSEFHYFLSWREPPKTTCCV
jgi:hypothetical protein